MPTIYNIYGIRRLRYLRYNYMYKMYQLKIALEIKIKRLYTYIIYLQVTHTVGD